MGKKILVIDDNEPDRNLVKIFLNEAGFEQIVMAETGEEGAKKAESDKPDLVITDTLLPGIDGFEVCRRIRKYHGRNGPKIIVITGVIDAIDAVKARKMGADDYCVKNRDLSDLIKAVKDLCQ